MLEYKHRFETKNIEKGHNDIDTGLKNTLRKSSIYIHTQNLHVQSYNDMVGIKEP